MSKRSHKTKRRPKSRRTKKSKPVSHPKLSRNRIRWQEIDALIVYFSSAALREFYAGAAKHLIPERNWSDSHPTTSLDGHPIVVGLHAGFDKWTLAEITQALDKSDNVLRITKLAANRQGRHVRRAKKYLTDLRKALARRLRRKQSPDEFRPERGLLFYDLTLKRKYYAPPRPPGSSLGLR